MEFMNIFLSVLLVFLSNYGYVTKAVSMKLLFPFGEQRGDTFLDPGDDISSDEVPLTVPIVFYDKTYYSVYVNNNGHLSFESELPVYQANFVLPSRFKLIAAFLADIDTTHAGSVYYRESTETALLEKAAQDIQAQFEGFETYIPRALFVATWDNVGFFRTNDTALNTFQIVIASDGESSFAFFNYLDDGLNWIRSSGKLSQNDPPAQAAFDSGEGRIHTKLPFSGTEEVARLAKKSNVGIAGVWMFKIGNTLGGDISGPGDDDGDVTIFDPDTSSDTCQVEGTHPQCHSSARCLNFPYGICCACIPPSYGNGRNCLKFEAPQRLNGKVFGTLNGISIDNLDMHAYVVTSDGRAYTAISQVSPELGALMLTLNTIGGIIGWMFALPNGPLARNGFMLTGGEFNRTAVVTYQSGEVVNLHQKFFGQDTLDQTGLETHISGVVPEVLNGGKVTVGDYKEEFVHAGKGLITSFSTRTYLVDGVAYQYKWNQTIMFNECSFDPEPRLDTMRLSSKRNRVVYDNLNEILRYAMTSQIAALTGSDPCRNAAEVCGENSECTPDGASFTCSCLTGFQDDGGSCRDIDECSVYADLCDVNARCYNVPGSFQCQCESGYRGDGRSCTREVQRCGDDVCHENGRCVYNSDLGKPMCECRQGFRGDGVNYCSAEFNCNEVDVCHQDAECVYDDQEEKYTCECKVGYSGDGTVCERYDVDSDCSLCSTDAQCLFDPRRMVHYCQCNSGYSGDGQTCTPITVPDQCTDCHPNARCVFDEFARQYTCQCSQGYTGDGFLCTQSDCRTIQNCHMYADCFNDTIFGGFRCLCRNGYTGDGTVCQPDDCSVTGNCNNNAQCVPDPRVDSRYMCRCNPGYEGDGMTCRQRVTPCNQVSNCGQNAECVYNPDEMSYRCRCSSGYEGNGFTCRPRGYNCRSDPRICDPNAACVLNVDTFICVCNENFRGDGRRCIAMDDDNNFLLFSRGYSIHRIPYMPKEDDQGKRILYVPGQLAIGIDSDCEDRTMYWTDVSNGQIHRANLDGTDSTPVITDLSSPEGVAVDWLSRNLYWTDSGLDVISASRLDGTYKKAVIQGNLVNPRSIVLDPSKGMMYWADWDRAGAKIEMAYMDGEDRKVLVDSDLGLPNGLTIDFHTQQVCWGDAGVRKIECIRSDGIGRKTIVDNAAYPFDLAMVSNNIYWSDWTVPGVLRVSHTGGQVADPLDLPVGGNGKLYGIAAVRASCPRAINACARDNGGCQYLCLPTPNGGRTCGCPDDVDPADCNLVA
ncbi:nidogen-2-like [Mizuhopecten yessoensis]|uniref:nidogen-2-like n=1 Tax=Mizuhopecten yessoensis TaxID=6573 RepID=UPI000B459AD3|nr:nidogen-2-like [Mizuhopecten yessoensis]